MIKVLKPGFYSVIQDFGRFDCQQYGVPYSGVMDRNAAGLANMILGNAPDLAVLEITITGPTLEFNCDTVICISGADMSPKINDLSVSLNKPTHVSVGDVLSFGKLHKGVRGYIAVLGGIVSENVLGSQSMYKGVTKQDLLLKNNIIDLSLSNSFSINRNSSIKVKDEFFDNTVLDAFKGPEFEKLTKEQQHVLTTLTFSISKNNSRMAYQLEERLENNLEPIITSPVLPGTVQLTPSGQLIILMRDCQTTGGYPRVLQLKESSINVLAQKFTKDNISFLVI